MSTVLRSVGRLIHDTSTALVDNQIPSKVSQVFTGFINSAFAVTEDVLKIIADLSVPEEETGPTVEPGEPGEPGGGTDTEPTP